MFSLQVELVALLKNHAVAVLIGVATRPQFQDEWSYTTLLDSTHHGNSVDPSVGVRCILQCPSTLLRPSRISLDFNMSVRRPLLSRASNLIVSATDFI
ncbi:hypothetical protein CHR55_26820 [Rhodococcus qingshengii]|uniref:Uncharacterized protein n=1 Tax=Rhodococcus qingshengii TaxID=334542 RepID=A0A2A5J4K3_RHOSG|nr:hypothetical protein CHR55_26820 [Rhodococcus qingshengii]